MQIDQQSSIIEIRDLKKSFGENDVLKGVNFTLNQGENVVVLGRSGSGKSVLIKCIVGLIQIDSGFLKVFDKNIPDVKHGDLDHIRQKIGFVFQGSALYDSMTVQENLEFPLRRLKKRKNRSETDMMVHEALENVGLADTKQKMPSELSGGMRKRIGLARALILHPEIMLYDEPTTGLDPITAKEISNLMLEMQKKYNTSSIIISHDMNCTKITANRMLVLIDGVFCAQGTFAELERSTDEKVKAFFE